MIKYMIHRPIAVTMILIALVVVGVIGTSRLPVSLMPNIDIPQSRFKLLCLVIRCRRWRNELLHLCEANCLVCLE